MYFTKLIDNKDKNLKIKTILRDVLKIDNDSIIKSENELNKEKSKKLSSDMMKKIRVALH